jgi:hypothetical protein
MTAITRIDVRVTTAGHPYAGTDGQVYLGIAGREFHLESGVQDFQRGSDRVYTLGEGGNVMDAEFNDPRRPPLDAADLDRLPMYVRLDPTGSCPEWNVAQVTVVVNPGPEQVEYRALAEGQTLWLGPVYGTVCWLRERAVEARNGLNGGMESTSVQPVAVSR